MRRLLLFTCLALSGCVREPVERVEWTVMGTVAALQARGDGAAAVLPAARDAAQRVCSAVERLLNAHDPASELRRLAFRTDAEVLARCDALVRPCYAAAFDLQRLSSNAFNPRWRGTNTLDLGAIAKGFAADAVALAFNAQPSTLNAQLSRLVDLGGNLKCVTGEWKTGVLDPSGEGVVASVTLRPGEALATSAEYYRGKHIYDGRTLAPVTNGVRSVTVLHPTSAMLADGLSTTLFVLGPEAGGVFVRAHYPEVAVLWFLEGRQVVYDPARRFAAR